MLKEARSELVASLMRFGWKLDHYPDAAVLALKSKDGTCRLGLKDDGTCVFQGLANYAEKGILEEYAEKFKEDRRNAPWRGGFVRIQFQGKILEELHRR